jgi:hypothetical protein
MIRTRSCAVLVCLLMGATGVWAADLPSIDDPVFHLTLPSSLYESGFPALPEEILQACHVNVKPDASYRYWVLASAEAGAYRYLMITGVVKSAKAAGGGWSADENGSFLRLSAQGCTPVDPANEVFANYQSYADDATVKIAKPVFVALANDAVTRFSTAFGSFSAFKKALQTQRKYPDTPDLAVLRDALKHYNTPG